MAKALEHIRKHPKLARQIIGLTLPQLEQLIKQAIAFEHQLRNEAEREKIRVASSRFRLHSRTYKQVIMVICGLVRFRIGAFKFSF